MSVTSNKNRRVAEPAPRSERAVPGIAKPGADGISRQLSRVLNSRQFSWSPLLGRILVYLIETALSGNVVRDATQIARDALGKGGGFCSSRDSSVRVAMNRLRKALQIYYADEGARDSIHIALKPGSYRPHIEFRTTGNPRDHASLALALCDAYQESLTRTTGSKALHALHSALRSEPEDPRLLGAYADICIDSYKYCFHLVECPLDEAVRAIEKALSIAPDDHAVLFEQGMLALAHDDMRLTVEIGNRIRRLHANSQDAELMGSWLAAHAMDPAAALSTIIGAIDQTSEIPGYYLWHPRFLAAYRSGNYELALDAAINFGLPDFSWGPMMRAAALAQLGLKDAAKHQLSRLLELNPEFNKNPHWHIGHHLKHVDTQEHLLEGLHKAGLRVA